jgi:hypothetical protein
VNKNKKSFRKQIPPHTNWDFDSKPITNFLKLKSNPKKDPLKFQQKTAGISHKEWINLKLYENRLPQNNFQKCDLKSNPKNIP